MDPVAGEAHEHEDVGRHLLCPDEDPEHEAEGGQVEACEDVLRQPDVGSLTGHPVQAHVQPDEARGVDQRPRVPPELPVVPGPVHNPLDLLILKKVKKYI